MPARILTTIYDEGASADAPSLYCLEAVVLFVAEDGFVAHSCKESTHNRAYDHDPEIGHAVAEEGRTEGACGIDGAIVDGDANDVDEAECETDGCTGEVAGSALGIGGAEDHEDEEEREKAFGEECHAGGGTGLKHVGCEAGVDIGCGASEVVAGSEANECGKKAGADGGTDELADDVAGAFACFHAAGEEHSERYGGIDVATGNVANGIAKAEEHQAEAQADAEDTDGGACQYGATAGKKHKEHRAYAFCKILCHRN